MTKKNHCQTCSKYKTRSHSSVMQKCFKSVSAIENKTNTSTRDFFQDHYLKIDCKTPLRNQRVASKSFQDHTSNSFKTMATCTCTETPFKTPAKDTRGRREQDRHKFTPFKTISVDGRRVIREKNNANRVKDTVKNRGRETSFRTMGRSWGKKVSFRDMEHEVSKATSTSFKTTDKSGTKQVFPKTIDNSGTKRVSFKTIEETNNRSISFKTFDSWAKARTANCDTSLKDALSFVSEKESALDGEKDPLGARHAPQVRSNPSNTEPSSQWTDSSSDPQPPREIPHGQRRDPHGAQKRRVHHGAHGNIPHAAKAETTTSFKIIRHSRQSRSRSRSRSRTRSKFFQDHWRKTQ